MTSNSMVFLDDVKVIAYVRTLKINRCSFLKRTRSLTGFVVDKIEDWPVVFLVSAAEIDYN